ncbi:MAG: hypothetical protein ACI8QZ_003600 [Chlamydiales bacterium]|jgi:hypothetical protein
MSQAFLTIEIASFLGRSLVLGAVCLQGCGPLGIGAALASGGSDGRDPSTVNFTETEPNETGGTANAVGPVFPSRTYIISAAHPVGADFDFFRIDATEPVRVQMTLTPAGGSDLVLLVGSPVDAGGAGASEVFVVDLMPGDGFAVGSTEFSDGAANYTLRLVGQPVPGSPQGEDPPPLATQQMIYLRLGQDGQVLSRTEITEITDTLNSTRRPPASSPW